MSVTQMDALHCCLINMTAFFVTVNQKQSGGMFPNSVLQVNKCFILSIYRQRAVRAALSAYESSTCYLRVSEVTESERQWSHQLTHSDRPPFRRVNRLQPSILKCMCVCDRERERERDTVVKTDIL